MEAFASNWNRWSADDERGTLNLLDGQVVLSATQSVRTGRVVSLGRLIRHDTPRSEDRVAPTLVLTADGGDYAAGARSIAGSHVADDFLAMPVATGTHLDGLAHMWSGDLLYNGHDANLVRSRGAKVCGIDKVGGIVTRGVLADICRLHGVASLPASHTITVDELEAATAQLGNPVQAGDALLLRTGWLTDDALASRAGDPAQETEPGIGMDAAAWIAERDIALVGADTIGVERFPAPEGGAPVHIALLHRMGCYLVELMDLEALAGAVEGPFLFVAAPLRLRGAINSPLNPLAIL